MKIRMYYHHTDCGGVVYYANYLDFLEEARTELLEKKGAGVKEMMKEGVFFVVARQEIDYKSPSFYGDTLEIDTRITNIGAAKVTFEYEVNNQDNRLIASAKTILVCVGKDLKPQAVPERIRQLIS
jgi:acyl-CoA thioester hydrolase